MIRILTSSRVYYVKMISPQEGEQLQTDSKFAIRSTSASSIFDTHFVSKLTVRGISKADYGAYTCKARNDRGEDQFNIQLNGTSTTLSVYLTHSAMPIHCNKCTSGDFFTPVYDKKYKI